MLIHRDVIKAALVATEKEDNRYAFNHVRVQPDGTVEATNGHIAFRVKERCQTSDAEFPTKGVLETKPLEGPAFISSAVADRLIKATAKKATIPVLQKIQVAQNEHGAVAQATDLEVPVSVHLPKGEDVNFPELERVWPKVDAENTYVRLILSTKVLAAIAKVVESVSTNKHSSNGVIFEVPTHVGALSSPQTSQDAGIQGVVTTQVRVRYENFDYTVDGVVMPCRE